MYRRRFLQVNIRWKARDEIWGIRPSGATKFEGQAQIVEEKEKKHYQGLPEDLTPTAGKVGASAAEK